MNTRDVITALKLPGVGPAAVRRLLGMCSKISSADDLLAALAQSSTKRLPDLSLTMVESAYAEADLLLKKGEEAGISALSCLDAAFPRALLDVRDFPPVIYVKGNLETLAKSYKMAVVGTRHASELGLRLARKIAGELSCIDVCVVSGLALGIDSAAHKGALRGPGSTVAVLAHGLDQISPRSNESLAEEILAKDGVLLSEYEIGVTPRPQQFVFRNRLQSGLSQGSIVVESGAVGGSIYQGQFTTEQRRLLFVVLPSFELPGAADFKRDGAERLAKEFRATVITRTEEVLEAVRHIRTVSGVNPIKGTDAHSPGIENSETLREAAENIAISPNSEAVATTPPEALSTDAREEAAAKVKGDHRQGDLFG